MVFGRRYKKLTGNKIYKVIDKILLEYLGMKCILYREHVEGDSLLA